MTKGMFVLLFCIGFIPGCYAQTKQESIKELFHLMKDDSTTTKILDTLMPMFGQKTSQEMDSTAKAKSQEKLKGLMEMIGKIIVLVREDRLRLYDQYYTREEINDLIEFYKSPAGRKYVKVTPEITKEIVMKVIKEYVPELKKK